MVARQDQQPPPQARPLSRNRAAREDDQSWSTTLSSELLIFSPPLYSMKPSFRNLFMKKFTRDRVVPTISASISCDSFRQDLLWFALLPVARQQQQRARQPFLARIEQMVDEIFLDPDVARQHVRDEAVGEGRLVVENLLHLAFPDDQYRSRGNGGRRSDTKRLTCEAAFTKKSSSPDHRHDRFFACVRDDGEFDFPALDVEHAGGRVALSKDDGRRRILGEAPGHTRRREKSFCVECLFAESPWQLPRPFHHVAIMTRTASSGGEIPPFTSAVYVRLRARKR